ncbi:MAG: NfeD family protein, partial [Candidatus Lutibacillus vidarii]
VGAPPPVQVVVAAAVAMLLLGLVRPVIKRRFTVRNPEPMGAAAHLGREALVVESVTAHGGQVKLVGELWSARAEDPSAHFPPGTTVVVVSVDGATVIVAGSAA